jgi:hypothetical protein
MSILTAIIIYRSDDDDFEKCLKVIRNVTDEVILLDPLQSDKALIMCRENKINYLVGDANGIGKNLVKAIESCHTKYILFLRSNECLSGQLKNSLLNSGEILNDDAYKINILKNYYGRWMRNSGLYPDYQVRLLKKQGVYHIDNEIEKIKVTGENGTINKISGDLFCMKFISIWEHVQTINAVTETDAHILFSKGVKTNILKMVCQPLGHFLYLFIIKLGFLDGFYGMINSVISGHSIFLKQVKLRELQRLSIRK